MNKIFCIGLSRTATTSFCDVLRPRINIKHYPNQMELYFAPFDGAADIPVVAEYKVLDRMFPNCKFVYTVREIEDWVSSVVPYFEEKKDRTLSDYQAGIRMKVFGALFPNEDQARKAYIRHHQDVLNYFKGREGDILILDIIGGDKPEKLFNFLGIKNPPKEFPKSNVSGRSK